MKGFLYGQTEYNFFNNTIHLDDYIKRGLDNHFDFLSITDVNLYGHYKFYKKCKASGLKPIIGLDVKLIDEDDNISTYLFYPYNNVGFQNLLKISTYINTNKEINIIEIINKLNGIHIIYNLDNSAIERYYQSENMEALINKLAFIKSNGYYIGISYTNNLLKINLNNYISNKCKELGIKTLPIHNCRYLEGNDVEAYEALALIGDRKVKIEDHEDYTFLNEPINSQFLDEFVNSINLNLYEDTLALPKYPNTKGVGSEEYLKALAYKGLEKRIGFGHREYETRLEYELSIIHKMRYDDYFLIVWDFIKYAKKNEILVGPGRGSAAGSLVSYCLGITEIDPLKYNLLFERFLNPERISMPDIDIDFPDNKRDSVIDYVKNLFGPTHICNISAYGTFQIKSSIRDLGRVKKIPNERIEELISLVMNLGFDSAIEQYKEREDIFTFLSIASKLNNLPRHVSTHAAGIILSDLDLADIIPLQTGINGLFQSQLEASDLEKIGLLKIDFLGIRNLAMIDEMVRDITGGFNLDYLRRITLNDKRTFELLQNGDTLGVFQLESQGIRQVLRNLKPNCFEEIVAVLALYRPGPMDNIDEFIARKNHKNFSYIHPILEPILKETYGIIVYQEQIMLIAGTFAGYSLGEADVLRRAVSKKNASMLKELEVDFINKSIQKGHKKEEAKAIYDLIYKFANYGFNKSHSVAYALVSYWMAYLKANYFGIFMSNMLNYVISNTTTLVEYLKYSKMHGLVIYKPNINTSEDKFISTKVGIFMPLTIIYSIGMISARQILEERENNGLFKNYQDFLQRTPFLTTANVEALIYAGALDIFGQKKKTMIENRSETASIFLKHLTGIIEDRTEFDESFLREQEKKYLGMNIEYDIYKDYDLLVKKYNCSILEEKLTDFGYYIVSFIKQKEIKTKNNELMLVGQITNNRIVMDFVIFPSQYSNTSRKLENDKLYIADGRISYNKDKKLQLIVNNVKNI